MQSRFYNGCRGMTNRGYLMTLRFVCQLAKVVPQSSVEYIARYLQAHFMRPRTMTLRPTPEAWHL
jgi:hypothetical protein